MHIILIILIAGGIALVCRGLTHNGTFFARIGGILLVVLGGGLLFLDYLLKTVLA